MAAMKLPTLFLFLCISACGQPGPIALRSIDAWASGASILNPTNLVSGSNFLWWVASDVPVGQTISNQWLDRIQSLAAQNMDPAVRPASQLKGAYFNGSTYLTNADVTAIGSTGWALLIIIEQDFQDANAQMVVHSRSFGQPGHGIQLNAGADLYWVAFFSTFLNLLYHHPNNYLNDILICPTNTTSHMTVFTNGVGTGADIDQSAFSSLHVDAIGADATGDAEFPSVDQFYRGWIREVRMWTNSASMTFTAADVAKVHKYATNTYGFTP